MRRIIKTIIENVKEYDEAMWGDGGYNDSLAGESIGFHSKEIEEKANKSWSNLKSIYSNESGVPSNQTLLDRGLNKEHLEIIEKVKKVVKENNNK